jgi:hypothetical protein
MRVCTRRPYSGSTRPINLSRIRRRNRIMVTKGRTAAPRQGAKKTIENILVLPGAIRKGNFRTTKMLSPAYPKSKLTSIRWIRPRVGDQEGIVTTC